MRKIFITAAAAVAATLAMASPAAAQYGARNQNSGYGQGGYNQRGGYDQRGYNHNASAQAVNQLLRDLDRAESQIQRAAQRRSISQREAQGLHREAANIRQRLQRAGRNGLSQREVIELRQRVNQLQQRVRIERRDNDNRRW